MKKPKIYNTTAWKYFRRWVLLKHAFKSNGEWSVNCATSKRTIPMIDKLTHVGHFVKVDDGGGATNHNTAFDYKNVMPQSYAENRYKSGNVLKMEEAINEYWGEGTTDEIKRLAKQSFTWKHHFKLDKVCLKELAEVWKVLYKEKINELGEDPWKN